MRNIKAVSLDWQDEGGVPSICEMREKNCLRMKFMNFDLS